MRSFICVGAALLLAGCTPGGGPVKVTANLDYANTSLGYRNSGVLSSGQLMFWDLQTNQLVTVPADIKLQSKRPTRRRDLEASQVRGFDFRADASLTSQDEATLRAAVQNKVKFTVKDAQRVDRRQIFTAVSTAYTDAKTRGENPFSSWRVDDATENPARFKFVLLDDEVRASSESIELIGERTASGSLIVGGGDKGGMSVSFPNSTTAKCSGDQVSCYINASVFTVFLNQSGGLDYKPTGFDREALAAALRDLS